MFRVEKLLGTARIGQLSSSHGIIDTPGFLVYTRRGGAVNLTPDLLVKLDSGGYQLDVLHFLQQPGPSVLEGYAGTGREFLGVAASRVLVATARDPTAYEYSGALRQASDEWASIVTHSGGGKVSPAGYMASVSALQPDVFVALSDEVPCDSKQQRAQASVRRTLDWLEECCRLKNRDHRLQQTAMFAAIQGGQFLQERKRCTAAMAALPGVDGFAVGGLGTGESPVQRREILRLVAAELPPDKLRMVMGIGTPEEVLEAVAEGVDLFDMGYLAQVTAGGYALSFPLSPNATTGLSLRAAGVQGREGGPRSGGHEGAGGDDDDNARESDGYCGSQDEESSTSDHTKINLWSQQYREDNQPLVPGCSCFACQNHTRAYVHHLLQAHEMLAQVEGVADAHKNSMQATVQRMVQVLLELHNTHHYQKWFATLRQVIAEGRLRQYTEWFQERASEMATAYS